MPTKKVTYQNLRNELDTILQWFEGDDLDVDEALQKYQAAIKLAKELEDYLTKAENKLSDLRSQLPNA